MSHAHENLDARASRATATTSAPRSTPGRRRTLVLGLVTAALMCLILLPLAELTVRVVAPQSPSWLAAYRRHPTLPTYALLPGIERLVDTGETRWTVYTDAQGYRVAPGDRSRTAQTVQSPSMLVLGDSFAFQHGLDVEHGYVGQLERLASVHALNSAVPGYGPVQYRAILEDRLKSSAPLPSLVLVSTYLGNDLQDCVWDKDLAVTDGILGASGDLKSAVKQSSHLYRLVAKVYHLVVGGDPNSAWGAEHETFQPSLWSEGGARHRAAEIYAREMKRIAELAAQHRIPVLAVILPTDQTIAARHGQLSQPGFDYEFPLQLARRALEAASIPYVDTTDALGSRPTSETYFALDGHLTEVGSTIVAELLAPEVKRVLASRGAAVSTAADDKPDTRQPN